MQHRLDEHLAANPNTEPFLIAEGAEGDYTVGGLPLTLAAEGVATSWEIDNWLLTCWLAPNVAIEIIDTEPDHHCG